MRCKSVWCHCSIGSNSSCDFLQRDCLKIAESSDQEAEQALVIWNHLGEGQEAQFVSGIISFLAKVWVRSMVVHEGPIVEPGVGAPTWIVELSTAEYLKT